MICPKCFKVVTVDKKAYFYTLSCSHIVDISGFEKFNNGYHKSLDDFWILYNDIIDKQDPVTTINMKVAKPYIKQVIDRLKEIK